MPRALQIVSFGLFALAALAQQKNITAVAPAGKWKISGTVVDAGTGAPLAHAQVAIAPGGQRDELHTIVTGENGRFLFQGLEPGKYILTAQHKSHLTQAFDEHGQYSTSIAAGPSCNLKILSSACRAMLRFREQSPKTGLRQCAAQR
jgi:hypothetical protein